MEIHGGKKRETGAGKNLSEGAKNKKNVGPVSGYFQAGKTFFGGIRLGTEEPRQFEGGFNSFGGFRRLLRSFLTVFLDIFLFCLGAILRPPEGGSRIFCLFRVAAVAVVADILRRSKTVFFLFLASSGIFEVRRQSSRGRPRPYRS